MIPNLQDTDFKKVREPDSGDDDDEDDDLEYDEYEINQAENCVQVIDHRRSDAGAARDKVRTALKERTCSHQADMLWSSERKGAGRMRDQGLVRRFHRI
jgi:hypothetical protein